MKKSLLLTFAILFSITMMAQNRAIFISESFDNSTMPVGWRIMETGHPTGRYHHPTMQEVLLMK